MKVALLILLLKNDVLNKTMLLTKLSCIVPEFELIFKGSDALERKGAFYAISDQDHPITKLMQYPRKVPRGTSVLLGLNIYKVFNLLYRLFDQI
jgi:hypothetical protein